ncbi:uncharacterized protein AKAW2_11803A [Aspergillus luchuensis]|uniref:Uncharacterized protein n=1 Tax=Aspergillus kawachii TaxID=1069201 RepID=A0A7R7ZVM7_ASPKA|nr:uncharacterized protein AKAW2_11803A [Aspergillus luchuensis]BCR94757.1 hypothetical protein AKAW2_11803A [Aspergillus luchuensis]
MVRDFPWLLTFSRTEECCCFSKCDLKQCHLSLHVYDKDYKPTVSPRLPPERPISQVQGQLTYQAGRCVFQVTSISNIHYKEKKSDRSEQATERRKPDTAC